MQHKKLAALGLSLALAATMTVPALAAERPLLISGNPYARDGQMVIAPNPNAYRYTITVNGEAVDTSSIPNIDGLPVRLVAEADHGSANWYEGESTAYFNMTGGFFSINFSDSSVAVGEEKVEGATLTVVDGVSFLPISFFDALEGVDVTVNEETNAVDIVTPNNDPLVKLSYELAEVSGTVRGGMIDLDTMKEYNGFDPANFAGDLVVGSFPMMISPDTLIVGKLAEGGEEKLKAEWDTYVQAKYDLHSWYLGQHLPKVEDARFEVENGYVICLIAENADETVAAFREAVKGL